MVIIVAMDAIVVLENLDRIFQLTVSQFRQISPYWIGGVLMGSTLSVYILPKINRMMGKIRQGRYDLILLLFATIAGVVSPICMVGTIPLIASLGRKGVPHYILASFMVSSILLNPNLLFMSFALGAPLALFRLFCSIAAGVLAGFSVKMFFSKKAFFNFDRFEEREGSSITKNKKFFKDLHKSITITAPYFIAGIIITTLFDLYFPKGFIVALFGANKGVGVLFAASLGVPVYVCGGGTIPLLALWLRQGMTPGSAIAFMLTGPATKLTNLSAVKIVLGKKHFIIYIAFNIVFAIMMGFFADFICFTK